MVRVDFGYELTVKRCLDVNDSDIKADDCEALLVREPTLSPVGDCPSDDTKPFQSYLPNVAKFFHNAPYFNTAR